jgi:sugar phosphate isomerase/epimerase
VARRQYGISTHLYHGQRLSREHLLEIAAHGFETVELFATRTHIDYHNPAAIADLQQWLGEAGLEVQSIHAPVVAAYEGGRWIGPLSIASADAAERERALEEAERALHMARRIPVKRLIAHLGFPRTQPQGPAGDSRAAARRSIEQLVSAAAPLGVQVVVELIPNELSRAGSLVHFVEDDMADTNIGVCLDFGHAHMDGNLVDAIETVSEHLVATHVNDNHGRTDEHLVPFDGTIDWAAALTTILKVGFDGPLVFEIAARGSSKDTLGRARKARERMERLLAA